MNEKFNYKTLIFNLSDKEEISDIASKISLPYFTGPTLRDITFNLESLTSKEIKKLSNTIKKYYSSKDISYRFEN